MEALFRFILTRPPVTQSEEAPSIPLSQKSEFQAALGKALQDKNPRNALQAAARKFIKTTAFTGDPKDFSLYEQIKELSGKLDLLEKNKDLTNAEVSSAIEEAFGATPAAIVSGTILNKPTTSIKDSLLAIKQLQREHQRPIEALTNQLRTIELIQKVADAEDFPGSGATLRKYRRRSVMLPTKIDLRSSISTRLSQKALEKKRREAEAKDNKEAEAKLGQYNLLKKAVKELTSLTGEHIQSSPQKSNAGIVVPAALQATQLLKEEITQNQRLSKLNLSRAQILSAKGKEFSPIAAGTLFAKAVSITPTAVKTNQFIKGSPAFRPLKVQENGFRLKSVTKKILSASTTKILKDRRLNISEQPLGQIIERLRTEITSHSKELDTLYGRPIKHTIKRIGSQMIMIRSAKPSAWNNIVVGIASSIRFFPTPPPRVPTSYGSVAPAGIADLLIVKQQLIRYEGSDVAHIENILKGEKKEREHIRRRETEELVFNEVEITTSEERELESTNRFEMNRETSETIKEDSSLKAGLTVSGSYGPVVEFSASVEGATSSSKEEAIKAASSFSQDVTDRSANKITERVLERSSLRVTNEVIDKNAHMLDNVGGSGHISGVYQWVNKVYQAQIYNYGIRTMYDFMVPEPGAFLIEALSDAHANALEIEKPTPFILRPDQITESNYHNWIHEYGSTDVQPPPEMYKHKSFDFNAGGGDDKVDYNHSGQIQIEEGYAAVHGRVSCVFNIWSSRHTIDVALGMYTHRFSGADWSWARTLSEERNSIPFALNTNEISDLGVTVVVVCQRTRRAMMKWRLDTHAKLTQAYKARLSEYEEQLAALEMQAGVEIEGKNPALNLELMKDELKKNCISIMTEQHFSMFDSIDTGSSGLPQIDIDENEAEGPYVRFFEQAFEWEHITWVTYPYFWGRKSQWEERISYEDTDPLFNQFLKAGYCRVTIPARPGFEGAIDHFMTYGEIWNGGPLPAISNPLYLPIADELAERLDRPGNEFPEGEPWLVRIPTSLVHLRADDKLPRWKQDSEGEWVEDTDEA